MPKDFSGSNLIGKSFEGQDLTGANFSGADIRGVNFKGTNLAGANFSNTVTGSRPIVSVVKVFMLSLYSTMTGFISLFIGLTLFKFIKLFFEKALEFPLKSPILVLFTIAFSMLFLITMIIAIRRERFWALVSPGALILVFALVFALSVEVAFPRVGAMAGNTAFGVVGAMAGFCMIILSECVFQRAIKGDEQFASLRNFILIVASFGGTDFRRADLSNANFSGAVLKGSRFNKDTIIKRTCWRGVKKIGWASSSGTILENRDVRELLVNGEVRDKNKSFIGIGLKGAHLVNLDLDDIDLTEADISNANLENASLKNANLTKTQALGVEFKGVVLTGACLEAWNIDSTTRLQGAHADYVYLLRNKKERRPSSGVFGEGEFSKLFQEVLNTIDFIFKNGVDWKVFVISFDKLKEKIKVESEETDIKVLRIDDKGDGFFVVRVKIPDEINKVEAHSGFMQEYDRLKMLTGNYQREIENKKRVQRSTDSANFSQTKMCIGLDTHKWPMGNSKMKAQM